MTCGKKSSRWLTRPVFANANPLARDAVQYYRARNDHYDYIAKATASEKAHNAAVTGFALMIP